ncbi:MULTISPECIES: hypothetical protein [unclassified Moorena]|nr:MULTISPECIES: hypothetical protein [unclassified Moorena]
MAKRPRYANNPINPIKPSTFNLIKPSTRLNLKQQTVLKLAYWHN